MLHQKIFSSVMCMAVVCLVSYDGINRIRCNGYESQPSKNMGTPTSGKNDSREFLGWLVPDFKLALVHSTQPSANLAILCAVNGLD